MSEKPKDHGEPPSFAKWLIWLLRKDTWVEQPVIALVATIIVVCAAGSGVYGIFKLMPKARAAPPPLILESIGNSSLEGKDEGHIAFALPFIDHPSSVNLPLIVRNTGASRLSNVTITLVLDSAYAHVLPAVKANKTDIMGPLHSSDRERTTKHTGKLSSATTFLRGMNADTAIMLGEPLVWTREYLAHIKAGNAPIVDLSVRLSADDVPKSSFTLRLQAILEVPIGEGAFAYTPPPFAGVDARVIMVSSEMGINEYMGAPCYVAKGLTTKDAVLKRNDQ